MSTKLELLKLLEQHTGEYVSGQTIGDSLNVSRNSIWKAVDQLKKSGYSIDSKPSAGYRLIMKRNILEADSIMSKVEYPCNIKVFDSVTSTNDVAKEIPCDDIPTVIIANTQSAGRGRLGRTFVSPPGTGLYLSILIKPAFDLDKALYVTMASAVAVCNAIESVTDLKPRIKWVNDIFAEKKKICGILTEGQTNFETGQIDRLIIGIGINCFATKVPEELNNVIGFLADSSTTLSRNQLAAAVINAALSEISKLPSKSFMKEYKKRCFIIGKEIIVHPNLNEKGIRARAIDIDENGGLIVEYLEGLDFRQMKTLTTGEVSIKIAD